MDTKHHHFRSWAIPVAVVAAIVVLMVPALALAADEPDIFTRLVQKGPMYGAGAAFLGGLLNAAMPCTYPMIAITVSVFGAKQAKSRTEAVLLSTNFVLGVVTLFTPLFVVSALSGALWGTALKSPWVNYGLVAFFTAMAASMFGAFDLMLPDSIMQRVSSVGGAGYRGAFVLGLVCGILATPCTGPVLGGMLVWIADTRSVVLGAVMGLMFSLGLGLPFFLVGAFAVSLPKGGKWMLWIKSFFGVVLLVVALYYLKNPQPALTRVARPDASFLAICAAITVAGLALGAVHLYWDDGGVMVKARKAVGIVLCVGGSFLFIAGLMTPKGSLAWEHSEETATAMAKEQKRPLLIDFTARWCAACQELAVHTFSDPRVQRRALSANFVAVKVDASEDQDPQVIAVLEKYKVKGLPTVLIYDSDGQERKRFIEFVKPEPFLAAIEGVQ
jgi:thiol:disulfide interchange protein DsbD